MSFFNNKLFKMFFLLIFVVVIAFSMQACTQDKLQNGNKNHAESTATPVEGQKEVEAIHLGEGEKSFMFTVTHKDGGVKSYEIKSNKSTVGEALFELKLLDGDDGPYGLYVKTVDGETLDFYKDKMYWSFYTNGEYAQKGVDQTDIVDGESYAFKAEK